MRSAASRILFSAGILLSLTYGAYAAPPTDIQMLPPVDFSNQTCAGGKTGILYWDGTTAIKCIPGFSGDESGNVSAAGNFSAGNLSTGGQVSTNTLSFIDNTMGALNYNESDLLVKLYDAPACAVNQALVKNAGGFGCVNIIDLTDIGTFPVPTCGAGDALTWTGAGTGFACIAMPVPAVPPPTPTCDGAGQALQFDGANFQCVTVGVGASCAADNNGFVIIPAEPDYFSVLEPDSVSGVDFYQCQNGAWVLLGNLAGG